MLHSSELYWRIKKEGKALGLSGEGLSFDWDQMQVRKNKVIQGLNQGITGLFKKNKVTKIVGEAYFESPEIVKVGDKQISARFFIIATGSEPTELPFLPFDEGKVISSTGALSLKEVPKKLAVIGAGVIGVELGSVFQRLGSEVIFVEFMDRICPQFDPALSTALQSALVNQGMEFLLSSKVTSAKVSSKVELSLSMQDGSSKTLDVDMVLVAVGRKAYTKGLCLDKAGISLSPQGLIPVDSDFKTSQSHILAIGDAVDGPMLAHKASEEGVAAAELCAGNSPSLDYFTIPNVIYTFPEVASVGLTEGDLKQRGIAFSAGSYPFAGNSRAKCTGEEEGFIKVLTGKKNNKILGVHMIGPHVSELIAEGALSLGKPLEAIGHLCHAHPTLSEAFKEAALSIHKKAIHK